jgi:hypothetical protein
VLIARALFVSWPTIAVNTVYLFQKTEMKITCKINLATIITMKLIIIFLFFRAQLALIGLFAQNIESSSMVRHPFQSSNVAYRE